MYKLLTGVAALALAGLATAQCQGSVYNGMCCDGSIIEVNGGTTPDDLICCVGDTNLNIGPGTTCTAGSPTPLAQVAAATVTGATETATDDPSATETDSATDTDTATDADPTATSGDDPATATDSDTESATAAPTATSTGSNTLSTTVSSSQATITHASSTITSSMNSTSTSTKSSSATSSKSTHNAAVVGADAGTAVSALAVVFGALAFAL